MQSPDRHLKIAMLLLAAAVLIVPINFWVWVSTGFGPALVALGIAQLLAGIGSLVSVIAYTMRAQVSVAQKVGMWFMGLFAMAMGLGGPLGIFLAEAFSHASFTGGAWGRPLRVRGRIRHPELRHGSDWTKGAQPEVNDLDAPTRAALEALWLHDAQKEHASVPAFSRVSWLLAAVGAPAELMEGAHRAALEEIDHARRCFALAAGYAGRSHSVEPMPELLLGGLDLRGDPFEHLATESLADGCLLEDFNADVAAACEATCEEPAVKDVLHRIAVEERSHAEFSWALLEWVVARRDPRVLRAVEKAASTLERTARPTAVSSVKAALVAKADPAALRRHGRIPDETWAGLWTERLRETTRRVGSLLRSHQAARPASSAAAFV
jgi:hypothetical protein